MLPAITALSPLTPSPAPANTPILLCLPANLTILLTLMLQVCVFAFDCLYHNGASLLHEPLTRRREVLHEALVEVPGQVSLATTKISNDVEELEVRRVTLCGVG